MIVTAMRVVCSPSSCRSTSAIWPSAETPGLVELPAQRSRGVPHAVLQHLQPAGDHALGDGGALDQVGDRGGVAAQPAARGPARGLAFVLVAGDVGRTRTARPRCVRPAPTGRCRSSSGTTSAIACSTSACRAGVLDGGAEGVPRPRLGGVGVDLDSGDNGRAARVADEDAGALLVAARGLDAVDAVAPARVQPAQRVGELGADGDGERAAWGGGLGGGRRRGEPAEALAEAPVGRLVVERPAHAGGDVGDGERPPPRRGGSA